VLHLVAVHLSAIVSTGSVAGQFGTCTDLRDRKTDLSVNMDLIMCHFDVAQALSMTVMP